MKQQGIALIQVLLIVAVLSVLALYLSKTAQDQVRIAQWSVDKAQAIVDLHSTEAELLFTLLTETKFEGTSSIAKKWNFYNEPFKITKTVQIKMQDQAGLINAHFPVRERLQKFIEHNDTSDSAVVVDTLLDWQDLDNIPGRNGNENDTINSPIRNGKIPHIQDLVHISAISSKLFTLLQKNMTINRIGYYNPMNSPVELLKSIVTEGVANQIVQLRKNKQLTKESFSQLTNLREEGDIFFYPSNNIAIEMTSKIGESMVKKKIVVQINPYATVDVSPVSIPFNRG
ncbi:general secretion pathway protein GspK [Colwelliaceae bacterium 6441]